MQSPSWYFNRLMSMDVAEMRWRAGALLRDQYDLLRIPLGWLPRLAQDRQSAPAGFVPGFRCSPVKRADWQALDPALAGSWTPRLLGKADSALANRLSYFDLTEQHHGEPFNWHRDFSAGKSSPVLHVTRTNYRDFSRFGDCKLVWEPNRHHQLVVLARAWRATGDLRYAEKVRDLLLSWIEANPFGFGMNWKSPLELAVRLINWVWALDLTRDADVFGESQWRAVEDVCYLAAWDVRRKLSRGSSANNHLIGEAAGVYVAAAWFANFPQAEAWRAQCKHVLEREIEAQTYTDGCTREHAFGYQFFVLQFAVFSLLAGRSIGDEFSPRFLERVHRMYRFLHEVSRDTGSPPAIGDQDDGYVLDLGEQPAEAASLIAVGGMLFEDEDLLGAGPSETCFWLFGRSGRSERRGAVSTSSVRFAESGYALLRAGESPTSGRMTVFFDCAELGYGPIAAHGHADALSITLAVDGRPVLVDAGTYDYFTYPEWREYFRSTRAHNTVEIDGCSQSQSLGPFLWGRKAAARLLEWTDTPEATATCGEHDGYTSLPSPLLHRRRLELDKTAARLAVTDTFEGAGAHTARWHFHLHPDCVPRLVDAHKIDIETGGRTVRLHAPMLELSIVRAFEGERLGWISAGYHRRTPSACIVAECRFSGNFSALTEFTLRV